MATAQSYDVNIQNPQLPAANGYDASWTDKDPLSTGKSFGDKLVRFFTGLDAEQRYQNALTENNRAYELALLKEQRNYDEYVRNREYEREDTKMQRLIADYKAAGMNPWLAIQGGISGTSAQGQPANNGNFERGSSAKANKEDRSSSGAISGLLLAVAKVISSL